MPKINLPNLHIHEWLPSQEQLNGSSPDYVIFGIHGLSAHGGWFERIAKRLTQENIAFYSYDLRGFGQSDYEIGHIDHWHTWVEDNQLVYETIKEKYPDSKIIILGHSLGATLAVNQLKIHNGDQLILSVPGFRGNRSKWDFWGFTVPTLLKLMFTPKSKVALPGSDDVHSPAEKDPLKVSIVTAKLLGEILSLNKSSKQNIHNIHCPVLIIEAENDEVICNNTLREYFVKIPSKDKTLYMAADTVHDWIWYDAVGPVSKEIISWITR